MAGMHIFLSVYCGIYIFNHVLTKVHPPIATTTTTIVPYSLILSLYACSHHLVNKTKSVDYIKTNADYMILLARCYNITDELVTYIYKYI